MWVSTLYLLCWVCAYWSLPVPIRGLLVLGIIYSMIKSYRWATVIMLLMIFMPFMENLLGFRVAGLSTLRIIGFVYIYLSLKRKRIRNFRMNRTVFLLISITILSILISSELRIVAQGMPPDVTGESSSGIAHLIGKCLNVAISLAFLYFTSTRLQTDEYKELFKDNGKSSFIGGF